MKFYMPVKIYDEPDCVRQHAAELAAFGKKALIVTGRRSAEKCGALADVTDALMNQGVQTCHFNKVEENPSTETIAEGARFGLDEQADFVIGIGGGSPLDAAKAIAFLMKLRDPSPARLYDPSLPSEALDVIAIPTTCGTGSEVTGVSVLTVHEKQTKASIPQRIFPRLALLDGRYLKAAPQALILSTAVDALAHMYESYESAKADVYNQAVIHAGLRLWRDCLPVLTGAREADAEDCSRLLRASTFAGMAIAQTGTALPHALSYILTYDLGMPHGLAAGRFLPGFLREAPTGDRELLLNEAGFSDMDAFTAFLAPALASWEVKSETLERAFTCVAGNEARMKACRFAVDPDGLRRICGL
ncbi:MAG: iron-containing alcohol dehydrogenase [Blautia sp.]|nr:iron-containing alcohol dehydrogenase [Blautia sp.]